MSGYFPDVQDWLIQGERNYRTIMRMFGDLHTREQRVFSGSETNDSNPAPIKLSVTHRSKYTTSLELVPQLPQPSHMVSILHLRLYHDVGVAEVVLPGPKHILKGVYPYPNEAMYQVDEKAQLNQLLGQWLAQCELFAHEVADQVDAD